MKKIVVSLLIFCVMITLSFQVLASIDWIKPEVVNIEIQNISDNISKIDFYKDVTNELTYICEIDINNIQNNTLKYTITDESLLQLYDKYSIKFLTTTNEEKTINLDYFFMSRTGGSRLPKTIIHNMIYDYNLGTRLNPQDSSVKTTYLESRDFYGLIKLLIIISAIVGMIIIKAVISKFFKIKETDIIVVINIMTQVSMYLLLFLLLSTFKLEDYLPLLIIISSILAFIVNYLFYKKQLKSYANIRLLLFALISDLIGFIINILVFIYSYL